MPPPTPASTPNKNDRPARSPRTAKATRSTANPAACETIVTPNVGSLRVSAPPEKSAVPRRWRSQAQARGQARSPGPAERLQPALPGGVDVCTRGEPFVQLEVRHPVGKHESGAR